MQLLLALKTTRHITIRNVQQFSAQNTSCSLPVMVISCGALRCIVKVSLSQARYACAITSSATIADLWEFTFLCTGCIGSRQSSWHSAKKILSAGTACCICCVGKQLCHHHREGIHTKRMARHARSTAKLPWYCECNRCVLVLVDGYFMRIPCEMGSWRMHSSLSLLPFFCAYFLTWKCSFFEVYFRQPIKCTHTYMCLYTYTVV